MVTPQITIKYNIVPPSSLSSTSYPSISPSATHTIPLEQNLTSASHPTHPQSNPPVNPSPTHDAHYTALSHALAAAQQYTNATLTEWKDAIGDKEKAKENAQVDRHGHKTKGMGKAMMMVRAAKEDGEADDAPEQEESEEEEDDIDGPAVA